MNTIKKLLKFGECLNFSDENLKGRFVFQSGTGGAGAGDTGGAGASEGGPKKDKPPVTVPEATEAGPKVPETAKTKAEKAAEIHGETRSLLKAEMEKKLQEIAAKKETITKEKADNDAETKKILGAKDDWATRQPDFDLNTPAKIKIPDTTAIGKLAGSLVGDVDATPSRIATQAEETFAKAENPTADTKPELAKLGEFLKLITLPGFPQSQGNRNILRDTVSTLINEYLHHMPQPVTKESSEGYKDQLMGRFQAFGEKIQAQANGKPLELMIGLSAYLKKTDPTFDFINENGTFQPEGLKNLLVLSDPAKLLDNFQKGQNLDKESGKLSTDKLNGESALAAAQEQPVDAKKMIQDGTLKFTAKTITLPAEADKIDEFLKEEFSEALDPKLNSNLKEAAIAYTMEKAKDLKQPGEKLTLAENGEITAVTKAKEDEAQKKAEETAKKLAEQASTMAQNPDVKPASESGTNGWMDKIGEVFSNFFKILAELMEKFGMRISAALGLSKSAEALKDRLKNWTPPPTEQELQEAGNFEDAMLKGIPKIKKTNLEKLLGNSTEMRNHILTSRPKGVSWDTYLFDKEKGRITAKERAQLEEKELKPVEISTMIMMKDRKGTEQPAANPTSAPAADAESTPSAKPGQNPEMAPTATSAEMPPIDELLPWTSSLDIKYTPQDVEKLNQIVGNDPNIGKKITEYVDKKPGNYLKILGMFFDSKAPLNPKIRQYLEKVADKLSGKLVEVTTKTKKLFPEGNINKFLEDLKLKPDWQQYTKDQLANSDEFRKKTSLVLAAAKTYPKSITVTPEVLDYLNKTVEEMGIKDKIDQEVKKYLNFDEIFQSIEKEFPELFEEKSAPQTVPTAPTNPEVAANIPPTAAPKPAPTPAQATPPAKPL